jgi:hypothetical protein
MGSTTEGLEFDSPRDKIFLLFTSPGTVLDPTQSPIQRGTWGSFSGEKEPGLEADCSHPNSAKVKNIDSIHALPYTPSWSSA